MCQRQQQEANDVASRMGHRALWFFIFLTSVAFLAMAPLRVVAAPYAAMVMDARTGEVFHSRNADTRLHPASLTKMMTLYIAFQAIERGEIGLDTQITISRNAANESPSRLGVRAGQRIALRYLIRAAAVKSANDAATAIGEAISGSEAAFAQRMNRTAQAMGMNNTTFRNAHGLTQSGHLSTARDMTILGRHLIYDFPQYYNLFSRRTADAGIATVRHTNRRWLNSYPGADGIKTGYTSAAGFNLVASAERGQERIIATVFGGSSTAARDARISELMDLGFQRAPSRATLRRPAVPDAMIDENSNRRGIGKTVRASGLVTSSMRPVARPTQDAPIAEEVLVAAIATDVIDQLITEAAAQPAAEEAKTVVPAVTPRARPALTVTSLAEADPSDSITPTARGPEVVTRISTSGGRHWGINVGRYNSRYDAERVLVRVALNEMSTLNQALRRVVNTRGGFDANFLGLTREGAELACRRLQARGTNCFMIGMEE